MYGEQLVYRTLKAIDQFYVGVSGLVQEEVELNVVEVVNHNRENGLRAGQTYSTIWRFQCRLAYRYQQV